MLWKLLEWVRGFSGCFWMHLLKQQEWVGIMEEKLLRLYLRDGQNALRYVQSLNPDVRPIATKAIFECLRLSYSLNNMEFSLQFYT